jgi:hypothetical protein
VTEVLPGCHGPLPAAAIARFVVGSWNNLADLILEMVAGYRQALSTGNASYLNFNARIYWI